MSQRTAAIRCRPYEARDAALWDDFVRADPAGTFFHLSAWRCVIERAFGHRPHYLLAERDGEIAGVLPLVEVRTRLFGHTLISNPFCVYGGPLARDGETAAALAAEAASLRAKTGARAVEFRYRDEPGTDWTAGPDLYVTFRKEIAATDEANLAAIPRKQRAMVRKAIANGLQSRITRDANALHRIYAESVRNLGTPVFARRYFRLLLEAFGEDCDILVVEDGGQDIAAVMNFYFRDEVLPYYGGGTSAARGRAGNDFLYWEVIRHASVRGLRRFDFGRSKRGTGAFAFKKNWGFAPTPLHYRFSLAPGAAIPEINPHNPKYRLFIAGWKRLPLPLANLLGPMIVRGVG